MRNKNNAKNKANKKPRRLSEANEESYEGRNINYSPS